MKFLFDNSDQHVGGHRYPDLGLDGFRAVAHELLDSQEMRKGHGTKRLSTAQLSDADIVTVAIDDSSRTGLGHEFHELGKVRLANVHEQHPKGLTLRRYTKMPIQH